MIYYPLHDTRTSRPLFPHLFPFIVALVTAVHSRTCVGPLFSDKLAVVDIYCSMYFPRFISRIVP
jgi:hypothetical protein